MSAVIRSLASAAVASTLTIYLAYAALAYLYGNSLWPF
jgi:hypothetical protein